MPQIVLAAPIARWLPTSPHGERRFTVQGTTLRQALEELFQQAPVLRGYLLDDQGALRHHVAAFLDGVVVRDKCLLADPVSSTAEIYLMQALSGG